MLGVLSFLTRLLGICTGSLCTLAPGWHRFLGVGASSLGCCGGFSTLTHAAAYLCPVTLLPNPPAPLQSWCIPGAVRGELEAAGERSQRTLRVTQPAWGTLGSRVASDLHWPARSSSESLPALSSPPSCSPASAFPGTALKS